MNSESFRIYPTSASIHFDIFTLFPSMFDGPFSESIIRRAQQDGLVSIAVHNIRSYTTDRHHACDDTPYGGGGGMVMKPEPIVRAVETVLAHRPGWALPTLAATGAMSTDSNSDASPILPPWNPDEALELPADAAVVLMTPQGEVLTQNLVRKLSKYPRLALICGRYEGIDERVRTQITTHEVSIGDFVLSGGELPAMVVVDAVTRVVPGALGDERGAHRDSHSPGLDGLLEGPQYTRPPEFRGEAVPEILLSGHHGNIAKWRRQQSLLRTLQRRPDLLSNLALTDDDRIFLGKYGWQAEEEKDD